MLHYILLGVLLGWGAAIPIGPINIEVVRRNLQDGFWVATSFGLGACCADLTYLILLICGALIILQNIFLLKILTIFGAFILFWFAYKAIRAIPPADNAKLVALAAVPKSYTKNLMLGYLLTLSNPITWIFWGSMSAQVAVITRLQSQFALSLGIGLMLGTVSWIIVLNLIVHHLRHRLPQRMMRYFNIVGGVIISLFACYSLYHVFITMPR